MVGMHKQDVATVFAHSTLSHSITEDQNAHEDEVDGQLSSGRPDDGHRLLAAHHVGGAPDA